MQSNNNYQESKAEIYQGPKHRVSVIESAVNILNRLQPIEIEPKKPAKPFFEPVPQSIQQFDQKYPQGVDRADEARRIIEREAM